jgi:CRISPR-associated protein Cas2
MFDLPSKTKKERRIYRRFRKVLLELGFIKMQFSVYIKYTDSNSQVNTLKSCIKKVLPRKGNIRIIILTDKQYETMDTFENHQQLANEPPSPDFIVF